MHHLKAYGKIYTNKIVRIAVPTRLCTGAFSFIPINNKKTAIIVTPLLSHDLVFVQATRFSNCFICIGKTLALFQTCHITNNCSMKKLDNAIKATVIIGIVVCVGGNSKD